MVTFKSSVTQQLLNDFGIFSVGIQGSPEGVTKCMPADALLETNLLSRALDVNAIDRIWPVRLRSVHSNACVNPPSVRVKLGWDECFRITVPDTSC